MSSSQPAPAPPLVDALPLTRRLLGARPLDARVLSYGGALPALAPAWRLALNAELGVDVAHDPAAPDPLASRVFGILYSRLRAEQVVRALSARTNLTLAGNTVRVVGDGPLAGALTALLRRLGAGVVRATDDPVERLEAVLDGLRVERIDAPHALAHATLLTGLGHEGLVATAVEGLVADASPRPVDAADAPSPRPHVRSTAKGSLVEMPPPLPTDTEAATSVQRRLLDALLAALIVDGGPDDARGVFAEAVTP